MSVKFRIEVESVMTTVKTSIRDAVLTTIEGLVIPRVELAMKSANASSGWSVDGNVLELDQRDLSGNIEGLQTTPSNRTNSNTDIHRIGETPGNFIVE